ncbi:MAG: tetratricopeptide repeat protein [Mariprofundales bacterium]
MMQNYSRLQPSSFFFIAIVTWGILCTPLGSFSAADAFAASAASDSTLSGFADLDKSVRSDRYIKFLRAYVQSDAEDKSKDKSNVLTGLMNLSSDFLGQQDTRNVALLAESTQFLQLYHDLPEATEAWYLRGIIAQQLRKHEEAVINWLFVSIIYPQDIHADKAKERIDNLLTGALKNHESSIQAIMTAKMPAEANARYLYLLANLAVIDNAAMRQAVHVACREFLRWYPDDKHIDLAQKLLADTEDDRGVAAMQYNKLLFLYHESSYQSDAMIAMADIKVDEKDYPQAEELYRRAINSYADTDSGKVAYMQLARLYAHSFKDERKALDILQTFISTYPNSTFLVEAWLLRASLYQSSRQYTQAIDAYRKVANLATDDEQSVQALLAAAKVARSNMKDNGLIISLHEELVSDYSSHAEAPVVLFENASIQEKKLHDNVKALSTYQRVVEEYPHDKLAKKAQKRVSALQKTDKSTPKSSSGITLPDMPKLPDLDSLF